jgi:hypothetical protein
VDCVAGSRNCLEPADTAGFLVDEAEVIFWGLCPACRRAAPTTVASAAFEPADGPQQG